MAWLSGFDKRKKIVLTGDSSGAQTDFQLKLAVLYAAAMQGDFDDLRFTQSDGTTLIDAWLESKVDSTSAAVLAEFPTTPANAIEQDYYMYYGNAVAASAWDGSGTFPFFDDGEGRTDGQGLKTVGGWVQGNTFNGNGINEYSNDMAYDGTISLHLDDTGGEIYHASNIATLPQIAECEMYVPSNTSGGRSYFSVYEGSSSWAYANGAGIMALNTNWYVEYGGVDHVTTTALSAGWHKLTIIAKTDGSADMYVDGNLLNVSAPASTLDNSDNKVAFGTYSNGYNSYIDRVRSRKYVANPPTYAFGSEESETVGESKVLGVSNPAKVAGVAAANVAKVMGV